jgi:hypothetical protein
LHRWKAFTLLKIALQEPKVNTFYRVAIPL